MPYIAQDRRDLFDQPIQDLLYGLRIGRWQDGDINYVLTKLVHGIFCEEASYRNYKDAIGALEMVKLELYRNLVGPYEDTKIALNGDVRP